MEANHCGHCDLAARGLTLASPSHMSSMHRTLDADVFVHHLTKDERMLDPDLLVRHGRTARTIVKDGPLRLTMMGLAAGGVLPAHATDAQVTIHLLEGEVTFTARGRDYSLRTGDVLVLAGGVEHEARSATGGVFLLTVVYLGQEEAPANLKGDSRNRSAPGHPSRTS